MTLRILRGCDVAELLPMDRCISLMRDAFVIAAEGGAVQPLRIAARNPDGGGFVGAMPGYLERPSWYGVKIVTHLADGPPGRSHAGFVVLFDTGAGAPAALVDAHAVTAIRTAAATAAATDVLARPDARRLALFGCGEQARSHLEALNLVRAFDEIVVWGRDPERTRAFCRDASARLQRRVEAVTDVRAAAEGADVLCTTTAAPEPFLPGAWIRPGAHLNLVGSSIPSTAEVDGAAVQRSRYFVDDRASALAQAGEFRRAVSAGLVGEDHIAGAVGDVIAGRAPGRTTDQDITVFKSLGMAVQDILSADHVLREAETLGRGVAVDW